MAKTSGGHDFQNSSPRKSPETWPAQKKRPVSGGDGLADRPAPPTIMGDNVRDIPPAVLGGGDGFAVKGPIPSDVKKALGGKL